MDNSLLAKVHNAARELLSHVEETVSSAADIPDYYAPLQEAADKINAALNGEQG